jgi:hypothetical protein
MFGSVIKFEKSLIIITGLRTVCSASAFWDEPRRKLSNVSANIAVPNFRVNM